jgi:hypothetical protein
MIVRHGRMTSVEPLIDNRLYSLDELTELRRTMLRYARYFPPGAERRSSEFHGFCMNRITFSVRAYRA